MIKQLVVVGGVLIALVPWMSGGSEPQAILITIFGLLLSYFLLARSSQLRTAGLPTRLLTALWIGWGAASILWSVNRFQSQRWLLYAIIAILVFMVTQRLNTEQKKLLLSGYVWVAAVAAVYGLYLYGTGNYGRFTTTFYWANPAAAFLLPAVFIAGWQWVTARSWLSAGQVLLLGTAFWLTDSRGALLALVVVLAVALLSRTVRQRWLLLGVVLVATFGLSLGAVAIRTHFLHQASITPGSRFSEAIQGESTSGKDRFNYLLSAFHIWENHPLLGIGAGTFATVHPQYQLRVESASTDAHNIFAQTLAEQGLIGWLILVYLVLVLAGGMVRGVRRDHQTAIAAAGAAFLFIHFGLDIDDRYPALIALLAMLIGISYQSRREKPSEQPAPAGRPYSYLVPAVLLAVALAISVSWYWSDVSARHGAIYDDNHQFTQAAAAYATAHTGLVYDPNNWSAEGIDYYTMAEITGGSKTYEPLARDRAQAAIARDPKDGQHYFLLGRVERLAGNLPAAVRAYNQALQLDRWNHPEYYLDLAETLLQGGDTVDGQQVITQALNLYPDSVIANRNADASVKPAVAELLALRAAGRLHDGDAAAATKDLQRASRLDPSNRDVRQLQAHGLGG